LVKAKRGHRHAGRLDPNLPGVESSIVPADIAHPIAADDADRVRVRLGPYPRVDDRRNGSVVEGEHAAVVRLDTVVEDAHRAVLRADPDQVAVVRTERRHWARSGDNVADLLLPVGVPQTNVLEV